MDGAVWFSAWIAVMLLLFVAMLVQVVYIRADIDLMEKQRRTAGGAGASSGSGSGGGARGAEHGAGVPCTYGLVVDLAATVAIQQDHARVMEALRGLHVLQEQALVACDGGRTQHAAITYTDAALLCVERTPSAAAFINDVLSRRTRYVYLMDHAFRVAYTHELHAGLAKELGASGAAAAERYILVLLPLQTFAYDAKQNKGLWCDTPRQAEPFFGIPLNMAGVRIRMQQYRDQYPSITLHVLGYH